ncbi:MAG: DUF1592 domain-containing protein [Pseudomonadota bacterium]
MKFTHWIFLITALFLVGCNSEEEAAGNNPAQNPDENTPAGEEENASDEDNTPTPDTNTDLPSPEVLAEGKALYEAQCASCHGDDGEGVMVNEVVLGTSLIACETCSDKPTLADRILRTMPPGDKVAECGEDCSNKTADYILNAFNSADALACDDTISKSSAIRRLNKYEIANAVNDVFGLDGGLFDELPREGTLGGFATVGNQLSSGVQFTDSLVELSFNYAEALVNSENFTHTCTKENIQTCLPALLEPYADLLYRRNVTIEELASIAEKVATLPAPLTVDDQVIAGVNALVTSADFLFVTPTAVETSGRDLSSQEIATKLALTLWVSVPDAALLATVDNDSLKTPAVLSEQIDRMMADTKFQRFKETFFAQWTGFQNVSTADVDYEALGMTEAIWMTLTKDMQEETRLFIHHIIDNNLPINELFTADYSFINLRLANHYGIPIATESEYAMTSLSGTGRKGLLTQGALLTRAAVGDHASVVMRGELVLSGFLCTPPPSPSADIEEAINDQMGGELTEKQKIAERAANASCSTCHAKLDAMGWAFTGFDVAGRSSDVDPDGDPVNPQGSLDGESFTGAAQMMDVLLRKDQFNRCFSEKFLIYTLGRSVNYNSEREDRCAINAAISKTQESGAVTVKDLVKTLLTEKISLYKGITE